MGSGRGVMEMIGRADPHRTVVDRLRSVAGGTGEAVLVEGEAGIGKTRLVDESLAVAEGLGLHTLSGRCSEDDNRPFGPVLDALGLRTVEAALEIASPQATAPGGAEAVWQTVDAVVDALEARIAARPTVLVIEDAHWAEHATLLTLSAVCRRARAIPLALVVTRRPTPEPPGTTEFRRHALAAGGAHVEVGALTEDDVHALAAAYLGDDPHAGLVDHLSRADGNPFLVLELLRVAARLDAGSTTATGGTLPVPALRALIDRVTPVADAAARLVRVASVLGQTFSVHELSLMTDRPAADLLGDIEEVVDAGVLHPAGDRYRFAHELVRSALYDTVATPVRTALHRDVATMLIERGADPSRIAHHLVLGAEAGDREAIAWLRRAADHVAPHAPATAADFAAAASGLAGADPALRAEIDVARARFLAWSGQFLEAERLARTLLAGPCTPETEPALRAAVVEAVFSQGREADAAFELLSTSHGAGPDITSIADVALDWLETGWSDEAPETGQDADADATAVDPVAVGVALSVHGLQLTYNGDRTGVELTRRAVDLADSDRGRGHWYGPHLYHALALVEADADEVEAVISEGERQARRLGAATAAYHGSRGALLFHRGDWDSAAVEIDTGIGLSEDLGRYVSTGLMHGIRARMATMTNGGPFAVAAIEAGEHLLSRIGPRAGLDMLMTARATSLADEGEFDAARQVLAGAFVGAQSVRAAGLLRHVAPDLLRLHIDAGDEAAARLVVDETTRWIDTTPALRALALRCRGVLSSEPDDVIAAVEIARTIPRPLELAHTCRDAARVLRDAGRREAATLEEEAVGLCRSLGANREIQRMTAVDTAPDPAPAGGALDLLSPTEEKVARLVAEGLTNREAAERLFISRRTVDNHLYRIFAKLGVANRVELAVRVASDPGKSDK